MQAQHRFEKNLVAPAQILDIDGRDRAIRNRQQRSFFGAHASRAQSNILDRARAVAKLANVAHANHFVAQNRYAAEQIRDRLLRAETDRQRPMPTPASAVLMLKPSTPRIKNTAITNTSALMMRSPSSISEPVPACPRASARLRTRCRNQRISSPQNPIRADDDRDRGDLPVVVPLQQRHAQIAGQNPVNQRARQAATPARRPSAIAPVPPARAAAPTSARESATPPTAASPRAAAIGISSSSANHCHKGIPAT